MATETWPAGQTTGEHTYAAAGDYTITATQAGGFEASTAVTLTEPPAAGGAFTSAVYSSTTGARNDERPIPVTDEGSWNIVAGPHSTWPATLPGAGPLEEVGTLGEVVAAGADYIGLNGVDALGVGSISAFLAGQPSYVDYHAMSTRIVTSGTPSQNPIVYGIYRDAAFTDPVWEESFDWTLTHIPQPYPLTVNATGLVTYLNDAGANPGVDPTTFQVDWGDGGGFVTEDFTGTGQAPHTYAAGGTYHIAVKTPDPYYLDGAADVKVFGASHVSPSSFAAVGSGGITFTVTADIPLVSGDVVVTFSNSGTIPTNSSGTFNGSGGLTYLLPNDAAAGDPVTFSVSGAGGASGQGSSDTIITPT